MGESLSWIAFKGISKDEALPRLSLRDTGEPGEGGIEDFAGTELPNGWYLILANNDELMMKNLAVLSPGCRVLAFSVMESIMMSWASCFEDGAERWTVFHTEGAEEDGLDITGTPPPEFEAIRAEYNKRDRESGRSGGVDYIFEIPVETAKLTCGYRYDQWNYEWGEPTFTILKQT